VRLAGVASAAANYSLRLRGQKRKSKNVGRSAYGWSH